MDIEEKYTVFRSPNDGEVYAIRNRPPRFTVKYIVGEKPGIKVEIMDIQDDWEVDPIRIAKLLRGIGESIARFLQREKI